ncbi:MAG: SET domain-containing protein-lysine N-methyltransferase [Jatrophihabitantaceae bacterium]
MPADDGARTPPADDGPRTLPADDGPRTLPADDGPRTLLADVRVGPSAIAGTGVFADGPMGSGTPVAHDGPINHSCDPNLWWTDGSLTIRRDVPAGEELTYDYATAIADPRFLLRCHCETYRCRQLVCGDDWRIPELQLRYAGHWGTDVQPLIDAALSG